MAFAQNSPIYLQICDRVVELIIRREWDEEMRIPSVREMSIETEVNPNTIARSYTYLQDLNIIHNKRGIGYFVARGAREIARKYLRQQFVKEELPPLFRMLDLLDMKVSDLQKLRDEIDQETKETPQ